MLLGLSVTLNKGCQDLAWRWKGGEGGDEGMLMSPLLMHDSLLGPLLLSKPLFPHLSSGLNGCLS